MEGAPPSRAEPPRRPESVTADDLRALRRWVVVAAVWAVAATAIALIALLDRSDSRAEKDADAAVDRIARSERTLDGRLDALESRLDDLPQSDDVARLQQRLTRAEKSATDAAQSSKGADEALGDLEDRVNQLEEDATGDDAGDERP